MKGIILAAGQGVRLRPLTDDRPKCMVEHRGVPLIDQIIESLTLAGVTPLVVVAGYCADILRTHLQQYQPKFYTNDDYATTNMVHSLFCAEQELDGDVIISYSDIIYKPAIVQALLSCPAGLAITIDKAWRELWQQRMDNPLADAETMLLNSQGHVLDLGRKPTSYSEIQGQYMGLIKFSAATLEQAKAIYHGLDHSLSYDGKPFNQMYMTTFLRILIESGVVCQSVPVEGGWLEVDAPSDLELNCVSV